MPSWGIIPGWGNWVVLRFPALFLANKADSLPDPEAELRALLGLTGLSYPALAVSATTGTRSRGDWPLADHAPRHRAPGCPPDRDRPFTLRRGQTVDDDARLVHKDLAGALQYARVWGTTGFGGQHVGRYHRVADGDVIELQT